jgi:hypothetical protein
MHRTTEQFWQRCNAPVAQENSRLFTQKLQVQPTLDNKSPSTYIRFNIYSPWDLPKGLLRVIFGFICLPAFLL